MDASRCGSDSSPSGLSPARSGFMLLRNIRRDPPRVLTGTPCSTAGDTTTATKALASRAEAAPAAASDVAGARERLARHVGALALVGKQRDDLLGAQGKGGRRPSLSAAGTILRPMSDKNPRPGPGRLHRDQMLARLQDLDRLRDLTEPYVTDSRADVRANALPGMPESERAEAEEIIARVGALADPPTLAALQQELLSLIAEMDVFYRDVLDREEARGAQADPEELRQAQEVLAALEGYRSQITDLKPGDTGSASFRLPPSPA